MGKFVACTRDVLLGRFKLHGHARQHLRKGVVQLDGQLRALERAQLGFRLGEGGRRDVAAPSFDKPAEHEIPGRDADEQENQRTYERHRPRGRPPRRALDDFEVARFSRGEKDILNARKGVVGPPEVGNEDEVAATGVGGRLFATATEADLDVWQRETDLVSPEVYGKYLKDGDTRGCASLDRLERAFEKVLRELREAKVGDTPAVWSVYNMGYVVKTRESLFSIDLVHRRALELAPLLDFAQIGRAHV